MAGRAGRPRYDTTGEIVLLAGNQMNSEEILEHYINSEPEPIRSQLSAEGPLRSHVLGLIASRQGLTEEDLAEFFQNTLFGAQYRKLTVKSRVKRALLFLEEEELIARKTKRFFATDFGKRVAMLYIDPQSAIIMRRGAKLAERTGIGALKKHTLGLLHIIVQTPDMMPKFTARQKDSAEIEEFIQTREGEMLVPLRSGSSDFAFYQEYDSLLGDFRTVLALNSWINESPEQTILEKYSIEPGDLHRMVDNADWLLYSFGELARLFGRNDLSLEADELRERVKYGIKTELVQLTKLEGIGRVRARALFGAGYTSIEKLSQESVEKLSAVPKIGYSVANQIKRQLP
jgi:helicase